MVHIHDTGIPSLGLVLLLLVIILPVAAESVSEGVQGPEGSLESLTCLPQAGTILSLPASITESGPAGADPRNIYTLREHLKTLFTPAPGSLREFLSPPPASLGSMPSTGIIRVPVILVQLNDTSPELGQTTTDVARKFFGEGDPALAPYESVSAYYNRSSYGELKITGDVLGWAKLPYSRADIEKAAAWAESQYPGHGNDLARCGLVYMAAKYFADRGVDFSQYDNDGNGVVDVVYLKFAGPEGGSKSLWHTCQLNGAVAFQSYPVQGLRFNTVVFSPYSSVFDPGNVYPLYSPRSDIYQTGHALGLPDYADMDPSTGPKGGIGGLDMMDAQVGDHNCFSKFLLGWLTPTTVIEGDGAFNLSPSSISPSALLIRPYRSTAPQTEFFMVEYRQPGTGNIPTTVPAVAEGGESLAGSVPLNRSGLVVWHVDAAYTADMSAFQNDNSRTAVKLLRLMEADGREDLLKAPGKYGGYFDQGDLYTAGVTLGENTTPDTGTNGGSGSGITIEPLEITDSSARVRVSVSEPQNPLPRLYSISPSTVPAGSGDTSLSLLGSGFIRGSRLLWNGVQRGAVYLDSSSLVVTIPSSDLTTPGNVSIAVCNPPPGGGTSGSLNLTISRVVEPVPVITAISPSNATAGGTPFLLTVTGRGFSPNSTICWNGTRRTTNATTGDRLTTWITSPDIAVPGDVVITVENGGPGGIVSNTVHFTVLAAPRPVPAIAGIDPTEVVAGGGDQVFTVTGSGFFSDSTARWNGVDQPTIFVSPGRLVMTVNASWLSERTTAVVTVFTPLPGGGLSNGVTVTVRGPENPVPVMGSIDPVSAPAGSGPLLLQVNGRGFCAASSVMWGGVTRETVVVNSTRLVATIPAGDLAQPGITGVTVRNPPPGGGTTAEAVFRILSAPTPVPTTPAPTRTPTPVPTGTPGPDLIADFSVSPDAGAIPLTVTFTDLSRGSPTRWYWTFGDGAVSYEQNPVHTYIQNGTYPVTLKVTGPRGSYKKTVRGCVRAGEVPFPTPTVPTPTLPVPTTTQPASYTLKADFIPSVSSGRAPLSVSFTDLSRGNPTRWYWIFGDGAVSYEQNPQHTYSAPGSYPVTLCVWNPTSSYRKELDSCIVVGDSAGWSPSNEGTGLPAD